MFPEAVLNVLVADNPWLEGGHAAPWVDRHLPEIYVERSERIPLDERVALVVGPRQAGKSTLIWKTLAAHEKPPLLVNCEEPSIRDWTTSAALFVRGLEALVPADTVVFFEEVQRLSDTGLFLKGLVDRKSGFRFVATGSSSFELESKTRESLAGRANRHLLLPLSSREAAGNDPGPAALAAMRRQKIFEQLVVFGGYPSVHLGAKKEAMLTGLVESFIIRDASDRFRIRHTDALRQLMELMASQVGNLCNYSDWASNTAISADTVREYASLLVETHVVRLVRPFVGGKRAEITSTPKVFFVDNGIRNRLFGGFAAFERRADRGAVLENFVFGELAKQLNPLVDSLRFWRSKSGAEVDFVVEVGGELWGIEVKAGNARGQLSRSSHSFIDAYGPSRFLVVNDRPHDGWRKGDTEVAFTTPWDLTAALEPPDDR